MSNRQTKERILEFISSFSETNGFPPTIREISGALGLKSTSTVHGHICRLKAAGRLTFNSQSPRSITLPPDIILSESTRRRQQIRIEFANGGVAILQCCFTKEDNETDSVSFKGILDASWINGRIGQVVSCQVIESL